MTKEQSVTLFVLTVGIASLAVAAFVSPPSPREETEQQTAARLETEIMLLKFEADMRSGYQRQLRQNAMTCEHKSGFQSLAAFTRLTAETIKDFDCRVWDWPTYFKSDPKQADDRHIRVRLPYADERWHWALKADVVQQR